MRRAILAAALLLTLAACAGPEAYQGPSMFALAANHRAADALVAIAKPELDIDKPIIVATIVDIDDLEHSSTFGRFISESVSSGFTRSHYKMVEMKFQKAVYMKRDEGEFMLTRHIKEIATSHQAQAVIVGTYSRARSTVFVNLKVVRPETNIVLAAYDYSLPITRDICSMLNLEARFCESR